VQGQLAGHGGDAQLRMAVKKAGPVVTDQGNLVLDVSFAGGITDPAGPRKGDQQPARGARKTACS
jgi:ribose 5-phosphate isomerase A